MIEIASLSEAIISKGYVEFPLKGNFDMSILGLLLTANSKKIEAINNTNLP